MDDSNLLKLNPVHCDLISEFLKLTQYQQNQRLKSIKHCFKNLLNYKVREDDTYMGEEVKEMLTELQDLLVDEIETELKDSSHTSVLLIQQLLTGAEQWHLTLTASISELENREKLNLVHQFHDELKANPEKLNITVTKSQQMIPVEDMTIAKALKNEIAQLETENRILKERLEKSEILIQKMESSNQISSKEKLELLSKDLESAQNEIFSLNEALTKALSKEKEIDSVQSTISQMSIELDKNRTAAENETERLRQDLEAREDKLRQIQSSLLLTEKELEKKFQATAAYANMKKLMVQKNGIIKSLRAKLAELGHSSVMNEGDTVTVDTDPAPD